MLWYDVKKDWCMMNSIKKPLSKIVTIAVSPYQTARGPIVKMGPGEGEATVNVGSALVHGKCLSMTLEAPAA